MPTAPVLRFAPSPTGRLHLGNGFSALYSFAAAQALGGRFLLRVEDIDQGRCRPEHEAALLAAKTALQVHGAIGYTYELDLHVWMKRAWGLEASWGTSLWHRRRLATAILGREAGAA